MCIYRAIYTCTIYFQMVCQKLCQNSLSGWGSLKESICFSNVMCSCVFCLPLSFVYNYIFMLQQSTNLNKAHFA